MSVVVLPVMFPNFPQCKGACKYYISTLGVGGGSEGNDYYMWFDILDKSMEFCV